MKKILLFSIITLGAIVGLSSCTAQTLRQANQTMQVVDMYESQARIWKSRQKSGIGFIPGKEVTNTGAVITRVNNRVVKLQWANLLIQNEGGSVVVYAAKNGKFVPVAQFFRNEFQSKSFSVAGPNGGDIVKVLSSSGGITVRTQKETFVMINGQ